MSDNITELEFKSMRSTVNNMTVNGVPINKEVVIESVLCKNCKNILIQFEPNQHIKDRMEYIQNTIKGELKYCPKCGCKINYSGCEILDAEVRVINE